MIYEIWLGDHYSHFERGVAHTDDGREIPLASWVHTATYGSDSVLIEDEECWTSGRFPVRWFTHPGKLEFYSWDETVSRIVLHNASSADILIDGFGPLPIGERMEIDRNE